MLTQINDGMGTMLIEMISAVEPPANCTANPFRPIVHPERTWFDLARDDRDGRVSGISASRWAGFADEAREEVSTIAPDSHVLGIALRPMDVTVFAAHKLVHEGRMQQGTISLIEPGLAVRGIFRGGYDTLHLRIRNTVIAECMEAGGGLSRGSPMSVACSPPALDPVIERLAHALIRADDLGGTYGQSYADGIGLAIVARLLSRQSEGRASAGGSRVASLPKWRLKRAKDYIAAHLAEPIGLAEIAASTGLTRMHFAAQFRAATGLRPHEYLVRQRIERAQELLAGTQLPLAAIALEVGFKAQAHFTTVFARTVGATPNAWRRQNATGRAGA